MKSLITFCLLFCFEASATQYKRKDWGRWTKDKSCLSTRHQVLKERSLIPVTIEKCNVVKGKWQDFYFAETITDPRLVDIDHVVPVAHAHKHGGSKWTKKEKRTFFNDKENLVITNRKANRQKGKKDFTQWMPISKDYACKYAAQWFLVKNKYKLTITEKEREYKDLMRCSQ